MRPIFRNIQFLTAFALIVLFSGCSLMYELQPHRLKRLNQGTGMSSDVYYSVSDHSLKEAKPEEVNTKESSEAEVIDKELGLTP